MYDFQQKKKIKKTLYSPIVLLLLAIIFVMLLRGVWGVYKKSQISYENLERERNELNKLAEREKTLNSSIEYLKTEQGIEDEIRTKFRAVKDGEQVAVIINEGTTTPTPVSTSTPSFRYKLFHLFR
jgi:cell division protein FtsB